MSPPREPLSLARYRYLQAPHRALRLRLFTITVRDQKPPARPPPAPPRWRFTSYARGGGVINPYRARGIHVSVLHDYAVCRFASATDRAPIGGVNYTADRS